MATIEERVAYLEGQVSEHTQTLIDIRDSIRQLEQRFDGRFDAVDRRIDELEAKFDHRIDRLEHRIEGLEDKFERRSEALEDRFQRRSERLEDKMSRHFTWLVGIQVTTLVAIVGALLARS